PPTLTLQYHFTPEAKWRPYVGVGVNYTRFTDPDLAGGLTVDRNSWGAALQAGIDIEVTKRFFVNLDVKKVFIDTKVKTAAGAFVTKLDIDPVIVGVGVGWKF
ncbi:MAG: OmpW family protein, partial [Betaproteobacteria bacterium]|nr:OmpW family protein [Betaproteobacteria bacterium]